VSPQRDARILSDYIDGESRRPEAIARRLQHDSTFAKHRVDLLRLTSHLRAMPEPSVDDAFADRVMARVRSEKATASSRPEWTPAWHWAYAVAPVAVVLVGVAVAVFNGRVDVPAAQDASAIVAESEVYRDDEAAIAALAKAMDDGAEFTWLAWNDADQLVGADTEVITTDELLLLLAGAVWDDYYGDDTQGPTSVDAAAMDEIVLDIGPAAVPDGSIWDYRLNEGEDSG